MVFGLGKKDIVQVQKERKKIAEAVATERKRQALLKFEARKAKAIARIRRPPLKVFGKKVRGVAVKAGRRAGKELGKSLRGFAQKVGKPREEEKETLVILGGQPRRVKGRVRIVTPADTALGGDLGLNVDLLGEPIRKKPRELKPMKFF